ncbi:hypothetical protein O6H91_05G080600 [Diphasiastrum complanatum]|uniref:Uncharacterized protein n=3 Tax=Diphasiastrum complanatum TaxID=34168 RepID=A0ACC2DQC1_DIPCM|nr:hypothetical protein O6H91_05G080600 [Diphasiastrum complanatum]KAJ7556388.1 hypothetical protein O6H91_05G080600 [Diphasiastrum complanatum]KAJ7556389.1 hypothetical protein O6H91_05G080600 [Diphasiastrum complanatum]
MDSQNSEVMETYYVSHGSPMLPLEETPATQFFKGLGNSIKQKPKAILVVSGHWNTRELMVNSGAKHSTIHDFYGFPRELYQLRYDAPGAPEVAKRVQELLQEAGYKSVEDPKRGLDHGAWIPLLLMYPKADIPVIQLSLQPQKDGLHHYNVGRALAPLTKEGVLIIGSGTTTHNLRSIGSYETTPTWAKAFDSWLNDALINGRFDEVIHYLEKGPHAETAHPTPDHFVPLLVALGAAGEGAKTKRVHHSWELQTMSMASFSFTPVASS